MSVAEPVYFWGTLALMLLGFFGIFFPIVPNIPLIWFAIVLYAVLTDYAQITDSFILFISFLALVTIFLDFIAAKWGVKRLELSPSVIFGAVAGGLIGSIFGALWSLFMGPLLGAVLVELFAGRDAIWGVHRGRYHIIGFMGGSVIKLVIAIAMIGMFLWVVLS